MAQGYDNNYYGDNSNSYSQYPTYDKNYECRTGPFEGFFVGSVEFCKHVKFDDRKDHARDNNNRTGIQGLPGPQGQAGITQLINGTNVYLVTRSDNATSTLLEVTAPCEAGDFVI